MGGRAWQGTARSWGEKGHSSGLRTFVSLSPASGAVGTNPLQAAKVSSLVPLQTAPLWLREAGEDLSAKESRTQGDMTKDGRP